MRDPSHLNVGSLVFQTRDGRVYRLRRATPEDTGLLYEFLSRLSDQTRRLRYMAARPFSPESGRQEAARMAAGCAGGHITLIATEPDGSREAAVAVVELILDGSGATGEIAMVVRDDAQGQGMGSFLLGRLVEIAQAAGVTSLRSDMLAENEIMQRLMCGLGLPYTTIIRSGGMQFITRLPQSQELLASSMQQHALQASSRI